MPAGRPKEHRRKLVAYVRKDTDEKIRLLVDKKSSLNTVGKVLDLNFQKKP